MYILEVARDLHMSEIICTQFGIKRKTTGDGSEQKKGTIKIIMFDDKRIYETRD